MTMCPSRPPQPPCPPAQLPTPAQHLLAGQRKSVGCPAWGWLQVTYLHGVDSKLGLGWATGRAQGEVGIIPSPVGCSLLPTSLLLTEAERDPASSSGSSASVSL